jgi:O-antigen/teichoic acid export membrane protein
MTDDGIDVSAVLSDVGTSSIRIFLSMVRGFVLIPVITKILGVDSYGIWAAAIGVIAISASVGGLHLKGSLIRYATPDSDSLKVFADTLLLSTTSGVILAGIVLVVGQLAEWSGPINQPVLGGAVAFVVLVTIISRVIINFPRAKNSVKAYEFFKALQLTLELVFVILIVYLTRSIVGAIYSIGVAALVVSGLVIVLFVDVTSLRPDLTDARKYLTYSLPMVPKSMSTSLLTNIDKYLILVLLTATEAGIYAVAYGVASLVANLTSVLNPTLYPKVTTAWDEGNMVSIRNLYDTILYWYTVLAVPMVFGIGILADPILRAISTSSVATRGTYLVPLIAVGFLMRGFDNPLSYILNSAEKNTILAKILLVAAATNLALNIVLITTLGLQGAVIATLTSQAFITISITYFARKEISFRLPGSTFIRALVASGLMATILIALPVTLGWRVQLVIYPILGGSIYVVFAYLLGLVSLSQISRASSLLVE